MKRYALILLALAAFAVAQPAGASTATVPLGVRIAGHALTINVSGVKHACTATVVSLPTPGWEYGQANCASGTAFFITPTTLTAYIGHVHEYKCNAPRVRIPEQQWTCTARVVR